MKTLTITFLLLLYTLSVNTSIAENEKKESFETTVLICTGKHSKRYHNSMCKGMKSCKGERKKVKLSEAQKMGLTKCGYCYK